MDLICNGEVDLIVNTTEGRASILESQEIRAEAVRNNVTYFTTLGGCRCGLPGHRLLRCRRGIAAAGSARGHGGMSQVPMTRAGEKALREELKRLRNKERPRLARAIGEAREHGDLRENAEYHAAKEQQGLVEARIRDIEGRLAHARVIDLDRIPHDGRVVFGVTVDLESLDGGGQVRYQIVGEDEAQSSRGRNFLCLAHGPFIDRQVRGRRDFVQHAGRIAAL